MNKDILNIFSFAETTPERVVIAVQAPDCLTVARHPYVEADWRYLSVSRGENHVVAAVRADGTTLSFSWGSVPEDRPCLLELRRRIRDYVFACGILFDSTTDVCTGAALSWNDTFKKWQINFETECETTRFWLSAAKSEKGAEDIQKILMECFPGLKEFNRTAGTARMPIWTSKISGQGAVLAPHPPVPAAFSLSSVSSGEARKKI